MAAKDSFPTTSQDVDAHVFYEVDWLDWLTARGFLADGSEIVSLVATVEAPGALTFEQTAVTVHRIWVDNPPKNNSIKVTSTITMPEPNVGAGVVTDQFTFKVKGVDN